MIFGSADLVDTVNKALAAREAEQHRLRRIANYVRGRQDPPYVPRGVNAEYRWIAKKARRNFLPLVIDVISENLHVDGYKPSGTTANQLAQPQTPQPEWEAFRANRMVSRQHGVHRAVIKYGSAYTVVLPGQMSSDEEQMANVPVIRPVSPRRMTAFYADEVDDEWPQFAIEVNIVNVPSSTYGTTDQFSVGSSSNSKISSRMLVYVYDEANRYILTGPVVSDITMAKLQLADPADILLQGQPVIASHGMGVCPVVRFLYEVDLDSEEDCVGEIEPIMPIQDQINFDTFNLMISTQFAAFRQRYVSGMAPVDEDGREKTPFRPGVDRVWASDDPDTKFGEFGETALMPYSQVREDGIRHMSTISQVPPYHLLGQVANMSAEALAAARDGLDRKIEELQAGLTDPWRNVFRLASMAGGNKDGWGDLFGTVVWRDTSARAFSATVDGLTKLAAMLGVPEEELWSRVPGATADDVASWQLASQREKAQQILQQLVNQQLGINGAMPPPGAPDGGGAPAGNPLGMPIQQLIAAANAPLPTPAPEQVIPNA
jgi:hypothetical protein